MNALAVHRVHISTPSFLPPGTGSPSFQPSSTWTRSWLTRSNTLKTSWPRRATRGRASSLTWTVCEWLRCRRPFLTVGWMKVSGRDFGHVPFLPPFSSITELCNGVIHFIFNPVKIICVQPRLPVHVPLKELFMEHVACAAGLYRQDHVICPFNYKSKQSSFIFFPDYST